MSILTGPEIKDQVKNGKIRVSPYREDNVGTNSLDLRIGRAMKVYVDNTGRPLDVAYREAMATFNPKFSNERGEQKAIEHLEAYGAILDSRKPPTTKSLIIPDEGIVLFPGRGYLAATIECVGTSEYVPILHGRSSIGRLFTSIHHTAGFGDTGFDGTWTLEITAEHPVRLYPDTRVCQIAFVTTVGERRSYADRENSKYNNQSDPGESRMHLDFSLNSEPNDAEN